MQGGHYRINIRIDLSDMGLKTEGNSGLRSSGLKKIETFKPVKIISLD